MGGNSKNAILKGTGTALAMTGNPIGIVAGSVLNALGGDNSQGTQQQYQNQQNIPQQNIPNNSNVAIVPQGMNTQQTTYIPQQQKFDYKEFFNRYLGSGV